MGSHRCQGTGVQAVPQFPPQWKGKAHRTSGKDRDSISTWREERRGSRCFWGGSGSGPSAPSPGSVTHSEVSQASAHSHAHALFITAEGHRTVRQGISSASRPLSRGSHRGTRIPQQKGGTRKLIRGAAPWVLLGGQVRSQHPLSGTCPRLSSQGKADASGSPVVWESLGSNPGSGTPARGSRAQGPQDGGVPRVVQGAACTQREFTS